jgi:hypothetical protein
MNKNAIFFLLLFTVLFSCKKKDGANQNLDPNKQEGSNYMSTKPGSWWLFASRDGDVTKRMATGLDSVKNGLLCSYFERTDTNTKFITPEYFGKNVNKYVSLYDMDGAQKNYVTLVFLLDSATAGTSWTNTQDYTYNNIKTNLLVESNVEFTDGTLTLGDSTYKGVTKVHNNLKLKLAIAPTYSSVGRLDVWFAKGIGIIMEDVDVNILSQITKKYTDSLLSYHIEP